jgi:hypothetical protein
MKMELPDYRKLYLEQIEIVRNLKADAVIMRVNIRDKFAMAALTGILSCTAKIEVIGGPSVSKEGASAVAYYFADSMMEARK